MDFWKRKKKKSRGTAQCDKDWSAYISAVYISARDIRLLLITYKFYKGIYNDLQGLCHCDLMNRRRNTALEPAQRCHLDGIKGDLLALLWIGKNL